MAQEQTNRPGKWRRRLAWTLAVLLLIVGVAAAVFYTPDTDRAAMIAKYSAPGDRFITLADGARVHVRDTGGEGPVMILLHGSNSSLHTWEPLKRHLRGYRIVTLDLPGHGLTGATPTGRYDTAEFIGTVDAVADAIGLQRFILGGNSMGGTVSWRYALVHPQRVQALLLIDAGGTPPRSDDRPPASNTGFRIMRSPVGRWLMERFTPRALIERSLRQSVSNQAVIDDAAVDRYWELLRFPGNREATMIRFSRGWDNSMSDQLNRITVPVLVLWGAEDRLINPSAAQSFAEGLPDDEVVMLPGIGHLPMEEAPQSTATAISTFLDRRLPAS